MKKGAVITFLLLQLLIWQSVAAATQWMYAQKLEGTRMGPCTEFVDSESVVIKGERMVYWSLWLFDEPAGPQKIRKVLWKNEALLLEPKQVRSLESYHYDADDTEVYQYLNPTMFSPMMENSSAIRALQYAKDDGRVLSVKPTDVGLASPKWYTAARIDDSFDLRFDVTSVKALPKWNNHDVPSVFEITVKFIWNEKGVKVRREELMRQKPQQHGYEGLSYSVTTYRFQTDANRMIILRTTDHDLNDNLLAFSVENNWRDYLSGSVEERIRKIGVRYFAGDVERM